MESAIAWKNESIKIFKHSGDWGKIYKCKGIDKTSKTDSSFCEIWSLFS